MLRLLIDVTTAVPDWTNFCAGLPLLPNRASEKQDYENLKSLIVNQARYVDRLITIKNRWSEAASKSDVEAATDLLLRESKKLSLLDCRLEIYSTVLEHVSQVAFNEIRLATDHTSNNDTKVKRAIVTFKQAGMLVDAVSLTEVAKNNKLIADISKISLGTTHPNAT